MLKLIRNNLPLTLIIFLAAVLYTANLHNTFIMASDVARELLRTLDIWQKREFTVIGPPLTTINNQPIELYFGSIGYYIGIAGLIFSHFNPIGSVYPNIILMLISVPFFYHLSNKYLGKNLSLMATIIYAVAPTSLTFIRLYWYPDPIIPLSVFLWYLFLCQKKRLGYVVAGVVAGIIFNLHYLNILPVGLFIFIHILKKDLKMVFPFMLGFGVALSPLIAFEIKNHFFLTNALVHNSSGFVTFSSRVFNPFIVVESFLYVFGLGPQDFYQQNLINLSLSSRMIIDTFIGLVFFYFLIKKQKIFRSDLILVLLGGLAIGWYFQTNNLVHLRYLFSVYPLIIIIVVYFVGSQNRSILFLLFIPIILLDWNITKYMFNSNNEYYHLMTIEAISNAIVQDNPQGKYNITENILGDARATPFRYFLQKDATVKPQNVDQYGQIDTLYVISPTLEKIYKDSRWEFNASGPKKIAWEKDFIDLKLFKFVK